MNKTEKNNFLFSWNIHTHNVSDVITRSKWLKNNIWEGKGIRRSWHLERGITEGFEWQLWRFGAILYNRILQPWYYRETWLDNSSFLPCGSCPVHCRVFSSISGFYPLDVSSNLSPICENQKHLQTLPDVTWGTKLLPQRNTAIE